ncbi:MAG: hypothetical protein K2X35_07920 [Bryobacteraceae bacterium]|nr:hypothetical protein [Bryobacteraceae bacterium]
MLIPVRPYSRIPSPSAGQKAKEVRALLCWWSEKPQSGWILEPEKARRFLLGARQQSLFYPQLRGLFRRHRPGLHVDLLSDSGVWSQALHALARGDLLVVLHEVEVEPLGYSWDAPVAPRRAPASPAPGEAPSPESPEDTFSDVHDPLGQVAALRRASRLGAPFCEECERARRQVAVLPQEVPVFSPGLDAALQAHTLRAAAAAGIPFCEECVQDAQRQPLSGPELDAVNQAQALRAAAQSGNAFCEECARLEAD